MTIRQLSLQEAEFIAHTLAVELMDSENEPIPPFSTRYPGKLESCLAQPFQTFASKSLYPSFVEKASLLFYLITKNHCFENGNKRMAVTLTSLFCFVNKRWLDMDPTKLYKLACDVAESDPKHSDTEILRVAQIFKKHLVLRAEAELKYRTVN